MFRAALSRLDRDDSVTNKKGIFPPSEQHKENHWQQWELERHGSWTLTFPIKQHTNFQAFSTFKCVLYFSGSPELYHIAFPWLLCNLWKRRTGGKNNILLRKGSAGRMGPKALSHSLYCSNNLLSPRSDFRRFMATSTWSTFEKGLHCFSCSLRCTGMERWGARLQRRI